MRQPAKTVATYMAGLPTEHRTTLERLRSKIRSVVPKAQERISYGIPTFVLDGRMLVAYGAAAKHCSLYPGAIVGAFAAELKDFSTSKGTIRFPVGGALPAALVRKIVKACVARNAQKAAQRKRR